jgi:APA family basic amino acid/polyamine antiporter
MKKILSKMRSIAQLERVSLKRVLGVGDLFAIGFGDLGSSIYYALGVTALYALGATPIALTLAGLVFICTAMTYAELSSTFHESGGTASFARRAFNDFISFIAGWGLLFDYIVTIAISAFAVAPYLAFFFPELKSVDFFHLGFTFFLILLLFCVNVFGVKQSTRMSLILVVATLITQAIVIVIGAFWLFDFPYIWDHIRIGIPNVASSPTWPEFWKGTAMAMVAYTGIESIAQLGSEAKKPSKTVPRAIMVTMFVLLIIYIGISLTALSAISPHELGTTYVDDPVAGIVKNLPFGNLIVGSWIGIFAALLLFTASNAGLIGASRLSFNMGEYYQLPRFFFRLHKRYRTPYVALGFFTFLSCVIVFASRGKLAFLADLYNFGAMLAFFFAHLSLIVLRIKKPDLERPFRVPFNIPIGKYRLPITAMIGCIATFSVWCLVVITKPEGRYFGFSWMALGIGMYFYYRRKQKIAPLAQLKIERIQIPEFRAMQIRNILISIRENLEIETIQMACELARLHKAKITAVKIIEVPASMPLDAQLSQRELLGEELLKRVEAIAREFNIPVDLRILRARSTAKAVLNLLQKEKFDLVVLSVLKEDENKESTLDQTVEKILKDAPCRVLVCCGGISKSAQEIFD